ncbi:MAG: HAMP domain-containing sensor histidine kinase [Cyanobacteria bacterium P01_G01_bin.38]
MSSPRPSLQRVLANQPVWKQLLRETRTRILLIYTLLMVMLTGMTVPVFRYLLFAQISARVRDDLNEERTAFLEAYEDWERAPDQSLDDLEDFIDERLALKRPEDDNFHLVLIDGELYQSKPTYRLEPFQPGSELFRQWQGVTEFARGEASIDDPEIGDIFYKADPLFLDGEQRGVFVALHVTMGERQEALTGVYLFVGVITAVVVLSLLLSWLLAGRLMAPIRALSKTARSISESDLTQRILVAQRDSELVDLANTFNAMMDRIQTAFDSQRDFVNNAGHELRTPITIIRGHLELFDEDPQARQETLELVIDELDRMGRLVNDMILLAKSERKDFLKLETFDIGALTEELFSKAQTLAPRDWQLSVEGHCKMIGDRQQLTGALLNLLRNAAQYTQEKDTIELGCRCKDNQVQFWVSDTGEGISPADQQRIFSRFARGQQRRSEGSGLGLAIVNAIAEAHGGNVDLVSQVGKGSTFRLNLPRQRLR